MILPSSCSLIKRDQLDLLTIDHPRFTAQIALQGAHMLSFHPTGDREWFYLSENAHFSAGKAIRGGVPICWPWFGASSLQGQPSHGVARTSAWNLLSAVEDGEKVELLFSLQPSKLPQSFEGLSAEYRVVLADALTLELTTHNASQQTRTVNQALHSYFAVEDLAALKVAGLKNAQYLDSLQASKRIVQEEDVLVIDREVDRIYLSGADLCLQNVSDHLVLRSNGSDSVVVWNPWIDKARATADMPDQDYLKMMCLETARVADDALQLEAGQSQTMSVEIFRP